MAQRLATRAEICGTAGTPSGVAPSLAAVTDDQLATWSGIAALTTYPTRYRDLTSSAHALLTAHYLATAPGLALGAGGGDIAEWAGPLTAEADGPASRSMAGPSTIAVSADDAALATTVWGRRYLHLRLAVRGFGAFQIATGT